MEHNGNMDDKDKVETYVKLYQQQMEHYHHTQDVEWRGNFGIWTLLAAAIYLTIEKSPVVQRVTTCRSCLALIVCFGTTLILSIILTVVHCRWLWLIHSSEDFDKRLWARYRKKAQFFMRNDPNDLPDGEKDHLPDDEDFRGRTTGQRWSWLLLEGGLTFVLCVFLSAVISLLLCQKIG